MYIPELLFSVSCFDRHEGGHGGGDDPVKAETDGVANMAGQLGGHEGGGCVADAVLGADQEGALQRPLRHLVHLQRLKETLDLMATEAGIVVEPRETALTSRNSIHQ